MPLAVYEGNLPIELSHWPNQGPSPWHIRLNTLVSLSRSNMVLPFHCFTNVRLLKYVFQTFFLVRLCNNPSLLVVWGNSQIWTKGTQSLDSSSSANQQSFTVDVTCRLVIRSWMLRAHKAMAIGSHYVVPFAQLHDLSTASDKIIIVSTS